MLNVRSRCSKNNNRDWGRCHLFIEIRRVQLYYTLKCLCDKGESLYEIDSSRVGIYLWLLWRSVLCGVICRPKSQWSWQRHYTSMTTVHAKHRTLSVRHSHVRCSEQGGNVTVSINWRGPRACSHALRPSHMVGFCNLSATVGSKGNAL